MGAELVAKVVALVFVVEDALDIVQIVVREIALLCANKIAL